MGEGPGAGANGHPRPQQSRTTTTNRLLQTVMSCWFEFVAGSSLGGGGGRGQPPRPARLFLFFFDFVAPEGARGTKKGTADVPRPRRESTAVGLAGKGARQKAASTL